jgi:uncharacterized protein
MMESLSDKLKSLGVQLGSSGLTKAQPKRLNNPIETVLQGVDDITSHGNTFMVVNDYSADYQHGATRLCQDSDIRFLSEWCRCSHVSQKDRKRFLFLDTETSGLAGGTGTFIFLIGLGFRTEVGFRLIQLFMRDPSQESALLETLTRVTAPFEVIVSFNGKGFDVPILNTRHVMNNIPSPFVEMEHIDMLSLARKLWRNRLPSRALKDLEVDILSLSRTQEEVPGWMIPELYYEYLRSGDARPLEGVFYHNGMDILSLAAIFNIVSDMLSDPITNPIPFVLDSIAVARMYEELGRLDVAIYLYEKSLDQNLPLPFFLQTLQRFALLYRKQGEWEKAAGLWKKAMDYHQVEAGIELAKYYEHQLRNYAEALHWAHSSVDCVARLSIPAYQKKTLLNNLDRRLDRLNRKVTKLGQEPTGPGSGEKDQLMQKE